MIATNTNSSSANPANWTTFITRTDSGLRRLKHLDRLVFLDLRNTKVTDNAVPTLAALRKLTLIDLRGTDVTRQGYNQLAAALPNALIRRGRAMILH